MSAKEKCDFAPNEPAEFVLPEPVRIVFERIGCSYSIVASQPAPAQNIEQYQPKPSEIVILIALQDSLGKAQFLIPSDEILDVRLLSEHQGRNLQAPPPDDWAALVAAQGLAPGVSQLAAVPQILPITCYAPKTLIERRRLFLTTGTENTFIKIEGENVTKFLQDVEHCKVNISTLPLWDAIRTGKEDIQLTSAVENFTSLRILQRLEKTIEIPPMPETAEKIIKLRLDPEASISDLAKVVETDPSLAAQVVSWASSPYYCAPGGISSVQDAVVRVLGFDLVVNLALGLALGKTMRLPTDGPRGIMPYWNQAVNSAALIEALVKRMDTKERPSVGLAYLSGLLHNFGYLILGFVFPPHFSLIGRYIEANRHQNHAVIEQHVLGICREKICAWVLHLWGIPEQVVKAIEWQETPWDCPSEYQTYAKLLFVANQMTRRAHQETLPLVDPPQVIPAALLHDLGLSQGATEEALTHVMSHASELNNMATGFMV